LRVKAADGFFCHGTIRVFDKRKTARTPGLAIDRHDDLQRLPNRPEVFAKIGLSGPVGQVSNEQAN
jgi:hypothetical protein